MSTAELFRCLVELSRRVGDADTLEWTTDRAVQRVGELERQAPAPNPFDVPALELMKRRIRDAERQVAALQEGSRINLQAIETKTIENRRQATTIDDLRESVKTLSATQSPYGTWEWASGVMRGGGMVRRRGWSDGCYAKNDDQRGFHWVHSDGSPDDSSSLEIELQDYQATDWQQRLPVPEIPT